MKRVKREIGISLLLFALLLLVVGPAMATDRDFFISSQSTDARAKVAGAGNTLNPGFNPCNGGTRSSAGVCSDTTADSLLGTARLSTLFPKLGPGAITDNMFGAILDKDPDGTNAAGTITTTACNSNIVSAGGATAIVNLELGLNCGDKRIDPKGQGQIIPTDPSIDADANPTTTAVALNGLNGDFTGNVPMTGDFCAGNNTSAPPLTCDTGASVQSPAHVGFALANNFKWIPGGTGCTANSNGSIGTKACARIEAGSGATPAQSMKQVTSLSNTLSEVGTRTVPGSKEQDVLVEISSFVVNSSTTTLNDAAAVVGVDTTSIACVCFTNNFVVTWHSEIKDPDFSGFSSVKFDQTLDGQFLHNGGPTGGFTVVVSDYPTGKSLTIRSTGGAPPAGSESIP